MFRKFQTKGNQKIIKLKVINFKKTKPFNAFKFVVLIQDFEPVILHNLLQQTGSKSKRNKMEFKSLSARHIM